MQTSGIATRPKKRCMNRENMDAQGAWGYTHTSNEPSRPLTRGSKTQAKVLHLGIDRGADDGGQATEHVLQGVERL